MTLKERWRAFLLPWIHKLMEICRNDPDVDYDDWKQMRKNYKDTVGKDYRKES